MFLNKAWHLRPLLLLVFVLFNGIIILSITSVIYYGVSSLVATETGNTRLQLIGETQKQLNSTMRDIELTAFMLITNSNIIEAVTGNTLVTYDRLATGRLVNQAINHFVYTKANISSIQLFTDNYAIGGGSTSDDQNRLLPYSESNWRTEEQQLLDNADAIWTSVHIDTFNRYNPKPTLAYIAKVLTPQGEVGGYLKINLFEKSIYDLLQGDTQKKNGTIIIIGRLGNMISSDSSLPENMMAEDLGNMGWFNQIAKTQEQGYIDIKINGVPYLAMYSAPNAAQWRIVEFVSAEQVYQQVYRIRNLVLGVGVIGLLLSFPLASYLSRRIIRPIPELLNGFKRIEMRQFGTSLDESNQIVEFQQISRSFNRMAEQLEQSLENFKQEHRAKREAELRVLQSQINPHFLYNTLDMINWMSAMKGAHEVSAMVAKLARMFRISLSWGSPFITLGEELEHSYIYSQIQQIRYKDKFSYAESIDISLKELYVPKLLLQPIIENAIIHGFKEPSEGSYEVIVSAMRRSETELCLTVENNGSNLPPDWDMVSALKAKKVKNSGASGSGGYGIHNVNERIRLYYGNKYGVQLMNREPQGVKVEIVLPVIAFLEERNYFADEED